VPRRQGSRRSRIWKKDKPHLLQHDRQPLVNPHNIEAALPLPYADDSAAVTPSSEDLCNSPFLPKTNEDPPVANGRRLSLANLTHFHHPLAVRPHSSSRRSSVASQMSRSSRHSVRSRHHSSSDGRSKMETLLMFNRKKSKAPDVVLDTSKLDDTVSGHTLIHSPTLSCSCFYVSLSIQYQTRTLYLTSGLCAS
jgi:hypothetical protein